jgi:hypothetical protein
MVVRGPPDVGCSVGAGSNSALTTRRVAPVPAPCWCRAFRQRRKDKDCLTLADLMGGALLVLPIVLTAVNTHVVFHYSLYHPILPGLGLLGANPFFSHPDCPGKTRKGYRINSSAKTQPVLARCGQLVLVFGVLPLMCEVGCACAFLGR